MTIAEQIQHARAQRLLTVEQFALLTQYHPQSIYRLIYKGAITIVRVGPRGIRIPQSEARIIRAQHPRADQTLSL
jgi:excisionase family DNA binding protein